MREVLIGMWSTLLWRGALSVVFGICAFVWPGNFMDVLTTLFGLYVIVDGALSLWSAFSGAREGNRTYAIIAGVVSIALGLLALLSPTTMLRYLILLIGAWNIYMGGFQIVTAFVLRKMMSNSGWQAFAGVISIAFGLLIIFNWWAALVSAAWLIGAAAIVTGIILLALGWKVRNVSKLMVKRA